ncbi:MAG: methyltransferase domain-containing protein [Myxococcota bacterium]
MSRRFRQHVNPLAERYMRRRATAMRAPAHLGPACAVEVELGCADGQFAFQLARARPDTFVVGLDIRAPLMESNQRLVAEQGLTNLVFGYVNLNVDIDAVFAPSSVDRFHVLFPDPWFKFKHRKRRVIEPWLLKVLCEQLKPGGELHFASDVFEVAMEAMAEIEDPQRDGPSLENLAGSWSFWRGNPFEGQSRREDSTLARGQRVWRMRYVHGRAP